MSETFQIVLLMSPNASYERRLPHGNVHSDMASTMQKEIFAGNDDSLIERRI
jgi:hypothetical protein